MNVIRRIFALGVMATIGMSLAWAQGGSAPAGSQQTGQTAATSELTSEQKSQIIERMSRVLTTSAFAGGADFSKLAELLAKNKEAMDNAKTPEAFAAAVNRSLQQFGYSHIVLFSPRAAQAFTTQRMVGLGVRLEPTPEGLRVVDVIADAPAQKAGVEVGDMIITIEGKKAESSAALSGAEGTSVKIEIKKADGTVKPLEITRRSFSMAEPETIRWVQNDQVAVVRIPSFMSYNRGRIDTIMEEAKAKAKMIVLDLRSNGGGAVLNLLHLSGHFFKPDEALGTFITRSMLESYKKEKNVESANLVDVAAWGTQKVRGMRLTSEPYSGQVVVLINGGTGSAGEMMAAGLQELRGSKVIGSRSAGAVLASTVVPVSNGFQLQYPFTDYITIKGVRLEGNGVKPDITAPAPTRFNQENDPGVAEALKLFTGSGR